MITTTFPPARSYPLRPMHRAHSRPQSQPRFGIIDPIIGLSLGIGTVVSVLGSILYHESKEPLREFKLLTDPIEVGLTKSSLLLQGEPKMGSAPNRIEREYKFHIGPDPYTFYEIETQNPNPETAATLGEKHTHWILVDSQKQALEYTEVTMPGVPTPTCSLRKLLNYGRSENDRYEYDQQPQSCRTSLTDKKIPKSVIDVLKRLRSKIRIQMAHKAQVKDGIDVLSLQPQLLKH